MKFLVLICIVFLCIYSATALGGRNENTLRLRKIQKQLKALEPVNGAEAAESAGSVPASSGSVPASSGSVPSGSSSAPVPSGSGSGAAPATSSEAIEEAKEEGIKEGEAEAAAGAEVAPEAVEKAKLEGEAAGIKEGEKEALNNQKDSFKPELDNGRAEDYKIYNEAMGDENAAIPPESSGEEEDALPVKPEYKPSVKEEPSAEEEEEEKEEEKEAEAAPAQKEEEEEEKDTLSTNQEDLDNGAKAVTDANVAAKEYHEGEVKPEIEKTNKEAEE